MGTINKINKTLIAVVLVFSWAEAVIGQGRSVEVVQDLKLGKTYRYEIRKNKEDPRQPQYNDMQSVTIAELAVIAENDTQKTCTWKYSPTRVEGIDPALLDEGVKKMLNMNVGINLVFHVDNSGMLTDLVNFSEVQEALLRKFDTVFTILMAPVHYSEKAMDSTYSEEELNTKVREALEKMNSTWSTPEMLLRFYYAELQQMHLLFGAEFHSDSTYTIPVELPNPFGGDPFPGFETYQLTNISGNTTEIHVVQHVDELKFRDILKKAMQGMGMPEGAEMPDMEIMVKNTYHYDYMDELLLGYNWMKKVQVDASLTVETTQVKLLP